jgi:2-dehydro-3-deoxygalactonokinase
MTSSDPLLLGIDWGTTSWRGYLIGRGGEVLARREADCGLTAIRDRDFAGALHAACGDWLAAWPDLPRLACGMVGSRDGWREAPYVACPADLGTLGAGLVTVDGLHIVPGLVQPTRPDVLRGEETQILGVIAGDDADRLLLLPGTHAKWVRVKAGRVEDFATAMTGELYGLLARQSILSRTIAADAPLDETAFAQGVAAGHARGLVDLFGIRALGLLGHAGPEALVARLSGILIGAEIAAFGQDWPGPVTVIGGAGLSHRYVTALALCGRVATAAPDDAVVTGLWRIAGSAGLLKE